MKCDHTSVGILVWSDGKLLLIERARPPHGFAPPSGHVDDHGTFLEAAIAELHEEVGLQVAKFKLIAEGRKGNPCRRVGGDWHYWKVYEAIPLDKRIVKNPLEVKDIVWCDLVQLRELANKTRMYKLHLIEEDEWQRVPGLEPVWEEWLTELGIIRESDSGS
jgi:8-oxo-dGTP pyrophosphatase MutT (NUDIX family)